MTRFKVNLCGPCRVGSAVHEAFSIQTIEGIHVGSGLNVEMDDGRRFIRIFDYDTPLRPQLEAYFSSRKRVSEVTFHRPFGSDVFHQ